MTYFPGGGLFFPDGACSREKRQAPWSCAKSSWSSLSLITRRPITLESKNLASLLGLACLSPSSQLSQFCRHCFQSSGPNGEKFCRVQVSCSGRPIHDAAPVRHYHRNCGSQ